MNRKVRIVELADHGDARGYSFSIPAEALAFVGRMADVHVASIKTGSVRGNHYHLRRREAIVVMPGARGSFHWDEGEGTSLQQREFDGEGAVLITIEPGASHALRNDGEGVLWFAAISSETYDPAESVARKVV